MYLYGSKNAFTLHVPIAITWATLSAQLNHYLPDATVLYADTAFRPLAEALRLHHRIELTKNGALVCQAAPVSDTIAVRIPMLLDIALQNEHFLAQWLPIKIPSMSVSLVVTLYTRLQWGAQARIVSKTTLHDYVWQSPLSNLSPIDVSKLVAAQIGIWVQSLTADIDRSLDDALFVPPYLAQGWQAMQETLEITDLPPLYLVVRPKNLYVLPIKTTPEALQTTLSFDATAYIGEANDLSDPHPFPDQIGIDNVPAPLDAATSDPLVAQLPIRAQCRYKTMSDAITGVLRKNGLKIGGFTVPVEQLRVYAEGERLCVSVRVSVSGAAGEMTVKGKPSLDVTTQTLYTDDLHYDISAGNFMFRTALHLLRPAILAAMRRQSVIPLRPLLQQWQQTANESIAIWRNTANDLALMPIIEIASLRLVSLVVGAEGLVVEGYGSFM